MSCYGTLRILRQFKCFVPLNVHKTLAETLVLSKISYCNVVYAQLPNYQINRLQLIQNAAEGYVLNRYVHMTDAFEHLKWLLIKENNEFSVSKLVFLALNDTSWPKCLPIETVKKSSIFKNRKHYESDMWRRKLLYQDQFLLTRNGPSNLFFDCVAI